MVALWTAYEAAAWLAHQQRVLQRREWEWHMVRAVAIRSPLRVPVGGLPVLTWCPCEVAAVVDAGNGDEEVDRVPGAWRDDRAVRSNAGGQ